MTYLDTIAAVDLHLALVVLPDDAELQDALGNLGDSESLGILGLFLEERSESGGDLVDGLVAVHVSTRIPDRITAIVKPYLLELGL